MHGCMGKIAFFLGVCVHACMHVHIVCLHVCMGVWTCVDVCIHVCRWQHACMHELTQLRRAASEFRK